MLSFICGTPGSGKADEIFRRAEIDANAGKSVFILVPEQYSMYTEHELITRLGLEAQNKIQVLTFSRLCNLVFSKMGPLRMKYIDNAGRYMLARKALQAAENDLSYLRPNVRRHGFAALAVSAISEFKRYGVSPEKLADAADKADEPRLGMKLRDLSIIYRKFNELTAEKYSNSEDNLTLILPKIADCDFLSGTIYINFFRSFTPSEYAALRELMRKADICCALCTDTLRDDSMIFSSQVYTHNKLRRIAEEIGTEVKDARFLESKNRGGTPAELQHLKNNFFAAKPEPMSGEINAVRIYRPSNYYSEVVLCARLIIKLCRTEGRAFNDFLILTGNMENYERIIPSVFDEFGIKYFLDQKTQLSENPFMRMMLSVLEILAYGFSYERIMTVVRSGFFPIEKADADIFENYILASGVTHKHWNIRGEWTYNPDPASFDMDIVNRVKMRVSDSVLDLAAMFSGRKTVSDICRNIYSWLSELGIYKIVCGKTENFRQEGKHEFAELLRLTWNSFIAVTNQMVECMGGGFVTFAEFYEIFSSACGELSVGMVPPTQDKVIVSEAERFRSTGVKTVIVLGVNDGVFPRSYKAEGIISDAERITLAEQDLELAPDAYNRQLEGMFLTYSVLTTATEQLFLLSPLGSSDGKNLGGSEVISKICGKIFPDIEIMNDTEQTSIDIIEGREYTFHELSSKIFKHGRDAENLSDMWQTAYRCYNKYDDYRMRLEKIETMRTFASQPVKLSLKTAEKLYGAPLILSVSKLERYNSCAFSFFMKYGLLAKERLISRFEANDMGTVLHSVLCDYFKSKSENNADYSKITRDECRAEISALTDTAAGRDYEILCETSAYYRYIILRMKSIAAATAWKLVKFYAQSRFRPSGFEISIGRRGSIPPYEISANGSTVYLEGFIDRLDAAEIGGKDYIAITDYKSSEKKLDKQLTEAGVSFQPLMYANMVCAANNNAEPAALLYMQMNDPVMKFSSTPTDEALEREISDSIKTNGIILDDPDVLHSLDAEFGDKSATHYIPCDKNSVLQKTDLTERLEHAKCKAEETAAEILGGGIDINPVHISGYDPCAFCPYSEVCNDK